MKQVEKPVFWYYVCHRLNPEKRNVPLYKNDAFQKVQKRRVQKSGEPGPSLHDQSPPLFSHLNTI